MNKLAVLSAIGIAVGGMGVVGNSLIVRQSQGAPVSTAQGAERSYDAADFARVSAVGPREVAVKVGPAFSVRGSGDPAVLDRYEVAVKGGALEIRPKPSAWWDIDRTSANSAKFYVTMPEISAASFVGSGEMNIDRVEGGQFAASLAGSGRMEIAQLSADDARFSVAGSGNLSARGKVREAHVSVAGTGDMQAAGLVSDIAHISIAGTGDAELTVNNDAHISTVGSGDVTISGTAHCTVSRIGSGDVRCPGSS